MVVPLPGGPVISYALFGKLVAHGDFISRGLTKAESDVIDEWLSLSMQAAKHPEWQTAFDNAPPWRFVRRANHPGMWEAGAISPCVDKVGRRFPILAFAKNIPANMVENIAENCEEQLYNAIGEGWTADILWEQLSSSDIAAADEWEQGDLWWTSGNTAFAANSIAAAQPENLIAAMLAQDEGGLEFAVQN